jgi:uncharacterized protein YfaS (alpha-2-macroglobulin family)
MERALMLTWLHGVFGGTRPVAAAVALEGPWHRLTTATGAADWRLAAGQPLPSELRLAQAPAEPISAIVQFDSAAEETPQLAVTVERKLRRVTRSGPEGYELALVVPGEPLVTSELYLDEVRLVPRDRGLRYGLLEVPLPPGASVENTTWGIRIRNATGEAEALERARHEPGAGGYVVPVDPLTEGVTLRHLVRFAQKGTYVLPPARLYSMYQPEAKAFDVGNSARRLEVR